MGKIKAQKINMTQIWRGDRAEAVTVLKVVGGGDSFFSGVKPGDKIVVSGKSKGRGFQGVVKRHGFHGGPKSHGQKDRLRAPGSIGATAPQRVIKGKKMAGHMGLEKVTLKNMEVAEIRPEEKVLMVKGAVPGMKGAFVVIQENLKNDG